jgi:uncharacterized protein with von Willebrand factor type A (vWA) domain
VADFRVRTAVLDLPALAGAFSRRLHDAGLPMTAERATRFADALALVQPVSRRRLYWTARAALLTDALEVPAFDVVFAAVFGTGDADAPVTYEELRRVASPPDERPLRERPASAAPSSASAEQPAIAAVAPPSGARDEGPEREVAVPLLASAEELLRRKRFDTLAPDELAQIHHLMRSLQIVTPTRLTRRAEHHRRGARIDMRRTLRGSLRTAGDPIRLARRRRRTARRRIVMLLDISGSMEPYARAYLQFLAAAAGSGPHAEAFVFATRLTRLTRPLRSGNPRRALERAVEAAPDWSSGTRIGDALQSFNDRHGRRGMARGAIVVILSDGWERGNPALVGREMERLARLAHRIVWVNPRAGAAGFSPQAGGMAAALAHCDALVSGHSLEALDEVLDAIAAPRGDTRFRPDPPPPGVPGEDDEPWASATPVAGSSVAMPSGYSPSRGKTTPGWTS